MYAQQLLINNFRRQFSVQRFCSRDNFYRI